MQVEEELQTPVKTQKSKVAPNSNAAQALQKLKVDDLKTRLKVKGLSTAGGKGDLIARLLQGPPTHTPPCAERVSYDWDPTSKPAARQVCLY